MSVIDTIKALTRKLTSTTSVVSDELSAMRTGLRDLRAELKQVRTAPLTMAEIEDRAREVVEREGQRAVREIGPALLRSDRGLASPLSARVELPGRPGHPGSDLMSWPALCAADPERAVAHLMALVRRVELTPGLPAAIRDARVQELTAQIAEIEQAEEKFVDDANKLGLGIAHRPDVVQRRSDEARARQLAEEGLNDRKARQAALDQAYERRPRATVSEYVSGASAG